MSGKIRQRLLKTQHHTKQYADSHPSERHFQEHDLMLVKLRPFKQGFVCKDQAYKMSTRFYGLFEIM